MRITTETVEGVTFLTVNGELDVATADELRQAGVDALTPITGTLRIDLSGVPFIDSAGLGALIGIRNAAGSSVTVLVQNAQPQVRRVLEITGLDHIFESV